MWIDANIDLGVFVAITKLLTVTVHSISNGKCLNWIKLTPSSSRLIQGVQLSKNGYFVIATAFKDKINESEKSRNTSDNDRIMRTCIQTLGINGEPVSAKPKICNKLIRGMMMKERSFKLSDEIHHDQSKKILERLMDDKIFFFNSEKAYIMNCVDLTEVTELERKNKKEDEKAQNNAKSRFLGLCLNSFKIITKTTDKPSNSSDKVQILHQTFEPLNTKWNEISDRLIM